MFGYLSNLNTPDLQQQQAAYLSHLLPESGGKHSLPEHDFPYKGFCASDSTTERDEVLVALRGHPHWPNAERHPATPDSVLGAYLRRDTAFIAELQGSFALAILDRRRGIGVLAVDKMGIERITYAVSSDNLVFSNNAEAVARFPGVGDSFRNQAFLEYLFLHMIPSPGTVFTNVSKLPPASMLVWQTGASRCEYYWRPDFTRQAGSTFQSLRDDLHRALKSSVAVASPDEMVGAFLSGGLDSSSIAGTLSEATKAATKTFSVGFGEEEFDELQYARITNHHFGCVPHEYIVKPSDIVSAFPMVAKAFDEPFGNSSAIPTYYCAKLAADNGVTHLLAGDGGDELFAGNERYARQAVFQMYSRIPSRLRQSMLDPLSRLISPDSHLMPLRKWRSYVEQANVPLPDRFETWNLLFREGISELLTPEFEESVNLQGPLRLLRRNWNEIDCESLLDHMLVYDWRLTLADNDLRKVGTMCAAAGVRVSYPLLHDQVVANSIQVPSRMKMSPVQLRKFYKRAMRGFLPAQVLAKKKHGFGLPFGLWLKTDRQLADLVYSNLFDLKQRNIVSARFLDRLIEDHRNGHPSYYGYVIWDLAFLEEWFKNHVDIY